MAAVQLITENIHLWASAIKAKSTQGRGSSKKLELYGIKKLRELILELAVRGKLVPQDTNDEPASALLERISSERAKLARDNKVKNQKKLPSISDYERSACLPDGWSEARLGDILTILNGRAYKKHEMLQEGTPLLRVGNLFTSNEWYYSNLQLEPEKYIDRGDLIYAWSASFGPFIWDGGKVIYHYHIWKLDLATQNSVNKNYLYQYLLAITKKIKASGNGIAMIHMTKDRMEKLVIPVPPLAEQIRITEKIDELMALCDQLEQKTEASVDSHKLLVDTLLETLTVTKDADELSENWARLSEHFDTLISTDYAVEQLKQTILQLAVMGKLTPQDPSDEPASILLKRIANEKSQLIKEKKISKHTSLPVITEAEKPFELPAGWEWCRVWDIAMTITSGSRDWAKYYSETGATFVTMSNLSRGSYALRMDSVRYVSPPDDSEGQRTRLIENDLLISITGDVGNLGLIPKNFGEAYINQHTALLRLMPEFQGRFIPEIMRSPWAKHQFDAPQRGIKNSFRLGDLGEMFIAIPPLAEQKRIVAKIDQLMSLCEQLKKLLGKTQTTLMHLADSVVYDVIGEPVKNIQDAENSTKIMKFTTILSLNHDKFDEHAVIAPIVLELGGSADAKDVWNKTKLSLPEFYAQLKAEIEAQYIIKPARAVF